MKYVSKPTSCISLKMHFFTIYASTLHIFLRVFSNFTVSTKAYLGPLPHQNGVLCDIIVKGWNSLISVKKSSTLDVVMVVDMLLVFEGYVFD